MHDPTRPIPDAPPTSPRDLPGEDAILILYIRERGGDCPSCDYDLAGLSTSTCPECGERLVLRVGLAEPRLACFITGLVGFGTGLGFCTILFFYFIWMVVSARSFSPNLTDCVPLLMGTLVLGVLLAGWIGFRRRLGRLQRSTRWGIAIGSFFLSCAFALWFFAWVG